MKVVLVLSTSLAIFYKSFEEAFKELGIISYPLFVEDAADYAEKRRQLTNLVETEQVGGLLELNDLQNDKEHFIGETILRLIPCSIWYLDTLHCENTTNPYLSLYKNIYSFEPGDVAYGKKKYNVNIQYLPLTAGYSLFCKDLNEPKDRIYDVSFVGMVNGLPERLAVLDLLARHCVARNYNLVVYGQIWHSHHWLQRMVGAVKFKLQHPELFKFVHNDFLPPEQVAELYKKSKINLNLHIKKHQGINCRTFEIMGNGNFELCDSRDLSVTTLEDGKHLVLYKDKADLLNKIDYYLQNSEAREQIAQAGGKLVNENYTLAKTLKIIFPAKG